MVTEPQACTFCGFTIKHPVLQEVGHFANFLRVGETVRARDISSLWYIVYILTTNICKLEAAEASF